MPLLTRSVQAPLTIDVRRGAVASLGKLLADGRVSAGGDVAVVVGPGQGEKIVELIAPTLKNAQILHVAGGTLESALELGAQLRNRSVDAVVGIGGGKTIDTTKYAASRYGLPMVTVATSLANDGIASPTATLDHDGARPSYGVHIPLAVFIDLDFVESGSDSQTKAGIGDVICKISAVADWELSARETGEPIDGLAVAMARSSAEALINHPGSIADDDYLITLAEGLIMAGLSMAVAGTSRPASGGCHEIMHAMNILRPGHGSHGEQVGLGGLFCTYLRGDKPRFAQMSAVLNRHGLPRLPADLGLSLDDFLEVVAYAPKTRPERYTILEHLGVVTNMAESELRARVEDYIDAVRS
ncbi:MAG: iron-containing alcohol dehydrogenase family protein [Hamadaea sp.]|nr:iron-containing alcohol dehydrogenase family protein [Hamadaea sp.]